MVYYQATPLIMKSKHISPENCCDPTQEDYGMNTSHNIDAQGSSPRTTATAGNVSTPSIYNHVQQQQQQHQQHQSTYHLEPSQLQKQMHQNQHQMKNLYDNALPSSINNSSSISVPQVSNSSKAARKTNITGTCSKPQFKCDYCGMTFGSKSAHTSHTKSHTKNGELGIMLTGIGGFQTNELMPTNTGIPVSKLPQIKANLNAVNTGTDPYQCNVCQKTFAVPARLIRHYRTHTGERPFECEFCHKLFSVKENLQVHRRIHTKERPYKCDVCGRAFEHSGKLHRHMRIHTGERPHKCETCGKTFIQSGQLVIHIRTHTGEKPYKCPVQGCKKDFTCSKQLKVHSRIHTGEKPYQCEFCKKCFGYNHVLKLHRRSHLATKCFQCNICEVTLISKKAIEAHIKGHANTIPNKEDDEVNSGVLNGSSTGATTGADNINNNENSASGAVINTDTRKLATAKAISSSSSTSSGVESTSSPNSPQSLVHKNMLISSKDPNISVRSTSPLSPSSTTASISSNSSYHSISPHPNTSSPHSTLSQFDNNHFQRSHNHSQVECERLYQQKNGQGQMNSVRETTTLLELKSPPIYHTTTSYEEEMPTDLRITPITMPVNQSVTPTVDYLSGGHANENIQYHYLNSFTIPISTTTPHLQSQQSALQSQYQLKDDSNLSTNMNVNCRETINPVLLEAACIAASHHHDHHRNHNDDVEKAAIQMMQLHHNQKKTQYCYSESPGSSSITMAGANQLKPIPMESVTHVTSPSNFNTTATTTATSDASSDAPSDATSVTITSNVNLAPATLGFFVDNISSTTYNYTDGRNADSILDHLKNAELKPSILTKGCAPVPKFQSSLHDNDIILRQVEAAIAPLRLSSDSPERSLSPDDSDTDRFVMLADRDVMTLPLRKRKLYMSEKKPENMLMNETAMQSKVEAVIASDVAKTSVMTSTAVVPIITPNELGPNSSRKVMRQSSVIQFAKAS